MISNSDDSFGISACHFPLNLSLFSSDVNMDLQLPLYTTRSRFCASVCAVSSPLNSVAWPSSPGLSLSIFQCQDQSPLFQEFFSRCPSSPILTWAGGCLHFVLSLLKSHISCQVLVIQKEYDRWNGTWKQTCHEI